jgi:hypothetical protein
MTGRFEEDARREIEQQEHFRRWIAERVQTIHATVSAADVLQRHGVKLRYRGQRAEQMFCPFHGNTRTMAARFHPSDARKPDHVWCYVCQKQWDSIALTKQFEGYEGGFSGLLRLIERDYGITPPEAPSVVYDEGPDQGDLLEVISTIDICERRLLGARSAFDMRSYLLLGSVLDKVVHGVDNQTLPLPRARDVLRNVLDKIGDRVRTCPVG